MQVKIVSWNMQGGSLSGESKWTQHVAKFFGKAMGADVVLLQECGDFLGSVKWSDVPRRAWKGRVPTDAYTARLGEWTGGDSQGSRGVELYIFQVYAMSRCNQAVVWKKKELGLPYFVYIENQKDADARPGFGIYINGLGVITTLHAFAKKVAGGGGHGGADVPDFIYETYCEANLGEWICGGDMNIDPAALAPKLAARLKSAHVWPPSAVTHPSSGTKLDYAVSSIPGGTATVHEDVTASDHRPVSFTFP